MGNYWETLGSTGKLPDTSTKPWEVGNWEVGSWETESGKSPLCNLLKISYWETGKLGTRKSALRHTFFIHFLRFFA